jgi:hypothetical protein
MRILTCAPFLVAAIAALGVTARPAGAGQNMKISGPHAYENLAVYFVHGESAGGPVPLTLQEALAKGSVQVVETGRVNELHIENTGADAVFIQAGDIVKGGKQDRVLTVSLLLPAKSGRIPIASFCVEQGRWSARGREDQFKFSSAHEAMPSKSALLAMVAPPETMAVARPAENIPANAPVARPDDDTAAKQRKVWNEVAATQQKLASGLHATIAAPQSATSLQLALENDKLQEARAAYTKALEEKGQQDGDIVGYAVAINGKMSSANVYPSNALFRKMWTKQLAAIVTEAIGEKMDAAAVPAPPAPAASAFLAAAENGKSQERDGASGMRLETRDAAQSLFSEARSPDGGLVHRNYLAK